MNTRTRYLAGTHGCATILTSSLKSDDSSELMAFLCLPIVQRARGRKRRLCVCQSRAINRRQRDAGTVTIAIRTTQCCYSLYMYTVKQQYPEGNDKIVIMGTASRRHWSAAAAAYRLATTTVTATVVCTVITVRAAAAASSR